MAKRSHSKCFGGGATLSALIAKVLGTSYCTLPPTKVKFAFTLAEVLITLGIIGVVAAMTIPNLLANMQEKSTINQLRKTQAILSQAIRLAEEEYGEVASWGLTGANTYSAKIIAEKLKPFLKIVSDCGVSDTNGMCVSNHIYYRLDKTPHGTYHDRTDCYKITLLNGSTLFWKGPQDDRRVITFWIDVNGSKLPNTYGKDLFCFAYENQAIIPLGSPDSDSPYNTSCKKSGNGWGCAYYVLHFGNMNYLHK